MIDLLMTHDNDLHLDGDLSIVDGAESVAQRVKNALLMHRGQWFLDLRQGMPWAPLLSSSTVAGRVDASIRAETLGVEGVRRVVSLSSAVSDGAYRAYIVIEALDGATAPIELEV